LAVIILTAYGDIPTAVEAMRRGVDDFIQKPYDPEALLEAVSHALARAGARFGEKGELSKLRARAARLTARERQVIHLVLSGMLNKEIADHLGLAEVTVKIHRSHAMRKLGAHNAAQLVRLAGFLEPGVHSAAE
jgi:FixJ family two-component response regulator